MKELRIGQRIIGPQNPAYIIAELSANHGQRLEAAMQLVEAAAESGADAVKLQTYRPDTITIDCDNEYFQIDRGTQWDGQTLYQLYRSAYTPWEWHGTLMQRARELGMDCFSSPFDSTAVDFLESLEVPAYKVASFELVDIPLLRHIGATRKPVIVSTGMASLEEIETAVATLRAGGSDQIALLKCTSAYPAPESDMHLRTIADMARRFDIPIGLSDHTLGWVAAVVAVSLGAHIVEKHLTLDRAAGGPDCDFSLEPHEFAQMTATIRRAEAALGRVTYGGGISDAPCRKFRRSLFVVRDIAAGELLTGDNVRSIRPGDGLPPKHFDEVIGRVAAMDLPRGTPLNWRHVA
jgi:pseudaminic acid synthase